MLLILSDFLEHLLCFHCFFAVSSFRFLWPGCISVFYVHLRCLWTVFIFVVVLDWPLVQVWQFEVQRSCQVGQTLPMYRSVPPIRLYYFSLFLLVYIFLFLFVFVSLSLSVSLLLSVCVSLFLYLCLSFSLSMSLSLFIYISLSFSLSLSLSFFISVCVSLTLCQSLSFSRQIDIKQFSQLN